MGVIEMELFVDKAPKTVENFVKLAQEGFYNGTKFHRVVAGFMIQGGDPLSKDDANVNSWGTGGPGYSFEDEIDAENSNITGTIAMANAGPNTNGSQFFINVADNNSLDTRHTVFGKVTVGMDVVTKISQVETKMNVQGEKSLPVQSVIVEKVEIK
ncbi:peptidylprolyl isomerase [Candidatus Parcubacteria bacterium]|nr:peptidylprolyl isomerase [Candidatus Parcubacteria bacterium]